VDVPETRGHQIAALLQRLQLVLEAPRLVYVVDVRVEDRLGRGRRKSKRGGRRRRRRFIHDAQD
jgi:hypothetical protein